MVSLKQKTNQILPVTTKKIEFCSHVPPDYQLSKKSNYCIQVDQRLQLEHVKKAIQADLGIFMHIMAQSGIFGDIAA